MLASMRHLARLRSGLLAPPAVRRMTNPTTRASHEWTLLFMHIPKTAGSSVRRALEPFYEPSERLYLYDPASLDGAIRWRDFPALPEPTRANLRFVMGHFKYGLHEQVPGRARYATVVRDAVDRVVSLYSHYRDMARPDEATQTTNEQRLIREQQMSLGEWVFGLERVQADNAMVRSISGRPSIAFGACPDDMLGEAIEHIEEHFELVLVQEWLNRSAGRLASTLGVERVHVPRDNVNESREELARVDVATLDRILELNHLDHQLHQHVRKWFSDARESSARRTVSNLSSVVR